MTSACQNVLTLDVKNWFSGPRFECQDERAIPPPHTHTQTTFKIPFVWLYLLLPKSSYVSWTTKNGALSLAPFGLETRCAMINANSEISKSDTELNKGKPLRYMILSVVWLKDSKHEAINSEVGMTLQIQPKSWIVGYVIVVGLHYWDYPGFPPNVTNQ